MPVQLPTGCVDSWSYEIVPKPTRSQSAFGTNVQHFARLGRHFKFNVQLHGLTQTKALEWARLAEETDTLLWDIPQGDLVSANEGSPRVVGASQTGSSLDIDGVTLGFVIPQGAFISIVTSGRRYVYQTTAAVTATDGTATVNIQPPLRVSPLNNDVVEISAPKAEGYVDFAGIGFRRRSGYRVGGISFTLEERG